MDYLKQVKQVQWTTSNKYSGLYQTGTSEQLAKAASKLATWSKVNDTELSTNVSAGTLFNLLVVHVEEEAMVEVVEEEEGLKVEKQKGEKLQRVQNPFVLKHTELSGV